MIKKIKHYIQIIAVSGLMLLPIAALPAVAHAADCTGADPNIQGCLSTGACLSADQAQCAAASDPNGSVDRILTTVINIFSLVVGVVSVIMIIIGGLKYITSGGDSGNVSGAKNTILYAIIGLVIVALAQVIVHFVLTRVSGTSS